MPPVSPQSTIHGRRPFPVTVPGVTLNRDKPEADWGPDIEASTAAYDDWYPEAAKQILVPTKAEAVQLANATFQHTNNLRTLSVGDLLAQPRASAILRQALIPTLARDRLVNLSGVSKTLIEGMERHGRVPTTDAGIKGVEELVAFFQKRFDPDLLPWLDAGRDPSDAELTRALTLLADRHGQACFNALFRNEQERRQKQLLREFLVACGLTEVGIEVAAMALEPGTFSMGRKLIGIEDDGTERDLPTDCVIRPLKPELPLIAQELKSAGDFANVNKRRKEEAAKNHVLRNAHGDSVVMLLQLFDYFGEVYLRAERAAGLDWVWDHRLEDLYPYLGVPSIPAA